MCQRKTIATNDAQKWRKVVFNRKLSPNLSQRGNPQRRAGSKSHRARMNARHPQEVAIERADFPSAFQAVI
jgi:hypothetical protein